MPRDLDGFTIAVRSLGKEEAARLSAAIRETPNILGYPPSELAAFTDCPIAESADGALAGVCVLKRLSARWSELAVVYVFPEYRRRGIGAALFQTGFRRLQEDGQCILCISCEPSVQRWMIAAGMRFIPDWRLPPPVQVAKIRYMASAYRWRELFRKIPLYRDVPAFRPAVFSPRSYPHPPAPSSLG